VDTRSSERALRAPTRDLLGDGLARDLEKDAELVA